MPLRFADTVAPERVRWLWPGYIPFGKVTVLDGDPGVGKSTVLLDVAARLAVGGALPNGKRHAPMGTILLMGEDGAGDTIVPRLMNAGADLARVAIRDSYPAGPESQELPPTFPRDLDRLREDILTAQAGMVVIDPVMSYLDKDISSNNDQQVRQALMPLAGLAEESGAAIVLLRHLNKGSGQSALYRGGGSIGFVGVARSGLMIARDPDEPTRLVLVSTKSNLGPPPPSLTYALVGCDNGAARIEWTGRSDHDADSLVRQDSPDVRGAHAMACEFLRDLLGDHMPMLAKEVWRHANDAGQSRQTVFKAAKTLGVVIDKAKTQNGGWIWTLPREVSTPGGASHSTDSSDSMDSSDSSRESVKNPKSMMYPKNPESGEVDSSHPLPVPLALRTGIGQACAVCGRACMGYTGRPLLCGGCRDTFASAAD